MPESQGKFRVRSEMGARRTRDWAGYPDMPGDGQEGAIAWLFILHNEHYRIFLCSGYFKMSKSSQIQMSVFP
jgi:hypothetical protein